MIECTRRIKFDAGHRVHLHESKCRNAHGHQYIVFIYATAENLDKLGRVIDFSVLKEKFHGWIDDNWDKFTGVKQAGITKEDFLGAVYGKKRFQGVINFMMAEDWSERFPQTQEWINLLNKQRNWDDRFLKVFPIFKGLL